MMTCQPLDPEAVRRGRGCGAARDQRSGNPPTSRA